MEYLDDTHDFDYYALHDVLSPDASKIFSDYNVIESVAEGGDKSNNDLSHTVHIDKP